MNKSGFDVEKLAVWPSLAILCSSLIIGFLVNYYVAQGFGKVSFFSSLMVFLAIFSSSKLLDDNGLCAFLAVYTVAHIALILATGMRFEHLYGPIVALLAVVDYAIFAVSAKACYGRL